MTLTINLCTRGRPGLMLETVERTLPNISRDDTIFMVSADRDDQETVAALTNLPSDKRILPMVCDREDSLGEKFNRMLVYAPADVYLAMVDYCPHITPKFDQKIIDASHIFPDGIGVIYNHLANASFPTINAVTDKLVKKMGFFYPPYFPYWFVDHWLDDIARIINRIAFVDIQVDLKKRPGTQDLRDLRFWTVLFDALYLRRRKMAHDIINSPDFLDPPWRKELSLRHHPLIEARTRWINDGMRAQAAQIEQGGSQGIPDEPRYQRVKAKAMDLMREVAAELGTAKAS